MVGFLLTLFLYVAFYALGELFRPKPKFGVPVAAGLGDFRAPTAVEGRAIPVFCGTCKIQGGNVTWYGDLEAKPRKKWVRTSIFGGTKVTLGYRYYLGMQFALCEGPIDAFIDLLWDDRVLSQTGGPPGPFGITVPPTLTSTDHGDYIDLFMNAEYFFGGDDGDGGVSGALTLYKGTTTQPVDAYLSQVALGGVPQTFTIDATNDKFVVIRGPTFTATPAHAVYTDAPSMARAVHEVIKEGTGFGSGDGIDMQFGWSFYVYSDTVWRIVENPGGAGEKTATFAVPEGEYAPTALCDAVENAAVTAAIAAGFASSAFLVSWDPAALYATVAGGTQAFQLTGGHVGAVGKPNGWALLGFSPDYHGAALSAGIYKAVGVNARHAGRFFWSNTTIFNGWTFPWATGTTAFAALGQLLGFSTIIDEGVSWYNEADVPKGAAPSVGAIPAYRDLCHLVLKHDYVGNSPPMKSLALILSRYPNGLGLAGGKQTVGGDSNPACWLYEIITNDRWGMKVPSSLVDAASFAAAGDTLYAEALGMSMIVDTQQSARDLVSEVLRHIDAVLYADPSTGLLTLKLARADYDPATLLELTADDIDSVKSFKRPSWGETRNVIKVRYTDRANNYSERVAQAMNLASIQAQGGVESAETIDFRGLSNSAAAQRAAAKALMATSYPLARLEINASRKAWKLRPGSVFKLTWAPLGIVGLVCRVSRLRDGEMRDGGIAIDAVEDVFAIDWTAYLPPGVSGWTDISRIPNAPYDERLWETPYPMAGSEARMISTLCAQDTAVRAVGYLVMADLAGGTTYVQTNSVIGFTPAAELAAPLTRLATAITVRNGYDVAGLASTDDAGLSAGINLIVVDDEVIAWKTVTDNGNGTLTLGGCVRGEIDTVPASHALTARVWFVTEGMGSVENGSFVSDLTVAAKLDPFAAQGAVTLASVNRITLTTNSRARRPYCPTALAINGVGYGTTYTGDVTVSWSHRSRLATWGYDSAGATSAAESGTQYRLRIYGDGGALKRTAIVLNTAASYLYTQTQETADNGGALNASLRFVLESLQTTGLGLASYQAIDFTATRV